MRRPRSAGALVLALLAFAPIPGRLVAQMRWSEIGHPTKRSGHAMATDGFGGKVLVFGGRAGGGSHLADTWLWDGTWVSPSPAPSPPAREWHSMAYDSSRQRVVLFGGFGAPANWHTGTWEWDGRNWSNPNPATSPPGRRSPAMAYDAARKRTVLFGGAFGAALLNDTWEWDGTNWTQRAVAGPPPTDAHAMCYDAARQQVILFGGYRSQAVHNDTWAWDGNQWTKLNPATSPPSRRDHRMAYDPTRQRIVLFGGYNLTSRLNDTWEWNGIDWSRRTASPPPARNYHGLAFHPTSGRIVLFGGSGGVSAPLDDVWGWDGVRWTRWVPPLAPAGRSEHAMAFDAARQGIVLFGGTPATSDTWIRGPAGWASTSVAGPSGRQDHAMTYDPSRQRVVLFGGRNTTRAAWLDDLWEWDGARWTNPTVATRPAGRQGMAMAYDRSSSRVVLVGGYRITGTPPNDMHQSFNDCWSWDGAQWRSLPAGPSGRTDHAMAYDAARGQFVLFGGRTVVGPGPGPTITYHNDTWLLSGTTWTRVTPPTSPSSRYRHTMTYDDARQRVVLFGGLIGSTQQNDAWEWDGVTWQRMQVPSSPLARYDHAAVYDEIRGETMIFGGLSTGTVALNDTWVYAPADLTASAHTISAAQGGPVLLQLDATAARANRPYAITGCIDDGARRGIPLGATTVLLHPDSYFWFNLTNPNTLIAGSAGLLDSAGQATATIRVPAGLPSALVGSRFYHAYAVFQTTGVHASSPVALTIGP